MKIIFDAKQNTIYADGEQVNLSRSLKVRNHSPSGFSFGYLGSGPAQSALALLLLVTDEATALRLYQRFKREVISQLPQTSFEADVDVVGWLSTAERSPDYEP